MKFLYAFLLFCLTLTNQVLAAPLPTGTDTLYQYTQSQMDALGLPGTPRYYVVHTPLNYNPTKIYPLILFLHAGTSNALSVSTKQVNLSQYADQLATDNKKTFITAYPQGYTSSAGGYWNSDNCDDGTDKGINYTKIKACTGDAYEAGSDDILYLNQVLNDIINTYPIDQTRVYAMGHSNGAGMTHRLACDMPNRIAAIAPIEGTTKTAACSALIPVVQFQSLTDPNSVYCGGWADTSVSYNVGVVPNMNSTCASNPSQIVTTGGVWQMNNKCTNQVKQSTIANPSPTLSGVSPVYQITEYTNCTGAVKLYTLVDAPHTWLYTNNTLVVDWRVAAWEFFQGKHK